MAAVLSAYFLVPVSTDMARTRLVSLVLLTFVALAVIGYVTVQELRRHVAGAERGVSGFRLVLMLELVVVGFALVYYLLQANGGEHLEGLSTRLDALYFSLTTVTTVGYGDISPLSQTARTVVTVQLVFDVVFLAGLARLLRDRLS